jgi:hypothetical protein
MIHIPPACLRAVTIRCWRPPGRRWHPSGVRSQQLVAVGDRPGSVGGINDAIAAFTGIQYFIFHYFIITNLILYFTYALSACLPLGIIPRQHPLIRWGRELFTATTCPRSPHSLLA